MLRLKFASSDERVEQLAAIASGDGLSLAQRRQMLLAVQRYVLGQRSDVPDDLRRVLETVTTLADRLELRIKGLELFRSAMEHTRRGDVFQHLAEPLQAFLLRFLTRGAPAAFSPELFLRVGRKLEETGQEQALVDLATLGLFFFPFHGPLRELRGYYCYTLGELGDARDDYDRLVEQYPERVEYLLDRAEVLLRSESFDDALEDLTAYLRQHPEDAVALRKKAECLYQLGRNFESHRILTKLMEHEGEKPDLLLNRARVNEQLEFFDEAIADADKALGLDPENQEAKQMRHSFVLKRQTYGVEDDVYAAYARGEEEAALGETKVPGDPVLRHRRAGEGQAALARDD